MLLTSDLCTLQWDGPAALPPPHIPQLHAVPSTRPAAAPQLVRRPALRRLCRRPCGCVPVDPDVQKHVCCRVCFILLHAQLCRCHTSTMAALVRCHSCDEARSQTRKVGRACCVLLLQVLPAALLPHVHERAQASAATPAAGVRRAPQRAGRSAVHGACRLLCPSGMVRSPPDGASPTWLSPHLQAR